MAQMSRAQRILLIYLLWELQKPRVIKQLIHRAGTGTGKHGSDMHTYSAYTDAEAVAAVEAEATLDLLGDVTIGGFLSVTDVLNIVTGNLELNRPYKIRFSGDTDFYSDVANSLTTSGDFKIGGHVYLTGSTKQLQTNMINETTVATGVTVDGVKLKDSEPYCDVVNEKTATAGVTVDGVLCKDNVVPDSAYPNALLLSGLRQMTGDLDLATYDVKFNDVLLANDIASKLHVMNLAKTAYRAIRVSNFQAEEWQASAMSAKIRTHGSDFSGKGEICFQGHSGAAWVTAAKLGTSGSYDPTFYIPRAGDISFLAGKALYNADHIELDEITTPTAVADHGKVYTKNDNKLYFQDGAGAEHEVAFV